MASNQERRRSERYAVNAEFAELEPGSVTFVSNLSEHGVFVNTRTRLPVGTPVDLRFTILLDDPVVISGPGRVVHHQDEPRGMGIAFGNLSAEMQLRVIDAIGWHRTREASRSADPGFRTRELTPEEMAQLEAESDEDPGSSIASLTGSAVSDDSLPGVSGSGVTEVRGDELDELDELEAPRRGARQPSAPPARKAPPPPPKDDDYEDF